MYIFIKILGIIVPVLICVAFYTVAERKVIGGIQRRRGPNVVGVFGLFQALADGLKLFLKESILPSSSSKFLFIFAPILTFFLAISSWGSYSFFSWCCFFRYKSRGFVFVCIVFSRCLGDYYCRLVK